MKKIFLMIIYHGIISIFILCFVSCDKEWKRKSDLEQNNIKGNICFIIEEDIKLKDGKEDNKQKTLFKYNRFGNIVWSDKDNLKCSYDLNGKIIVRETSKMTYFTDEGKFKPITTYWKYYYDETGYSNKVTQYSMSENNLLSTAYIIRDNLHYKTKIVELNQKVNMDGSRYVDTLTVSYEYNKKKGLLKMLTIYSGKRETRTTYSYGSDNELIKKHDKDINVYKDSTAYYSFKDGSLLGYNYFDINTNIVETYEYDQYGNTIHLNVCDSTSNTEEDTYWTYQYDSNNNWIKCEEYDNLHKLVSYKTRKIEYYPTDEKGSVDYSWENEKSPMEQEHEKDEIRKRKEQAYLNDEFILEQFYTKMKEYPNYRIKGKPKIVYRDYCTYRINFDALYSWDANFYYPEKVNRTVEIVLNLDDDTYSFVPIKGHLD